jgi:hypothetical protein
MEDYRKRFRKYNGEEIGDIIDTNLILFIKVSFPI